MQRYALPATGIRAHGLPEIFSSGAAASDSDGGHLLPSARGGTLVGTGGPWRTPGGPRQEESSHSSEIT